MSEHEVISPSAYSGSVGGKLVPRNCALLKFERVCKKKSHLRLNFGACGEADRHQLGSRTTQYKESMHDSVADSAV